MPLKLSYTVHGVDSQEIERTITTDDGDEARLTIRGKRVQLVSERDDQDTIGFFLSDAAADKAGLNWEAGDTITITFHRES